MAYTTIDDSEAYFQVKTYTGTGSSLAITLDGDTDMQPDMVWIKERNGATNHMVTDSVRGATKTLHPQNTDQESTDAEALKSFDSDGFTVGTDGDVNTGSDTYVAWCWKAGTSFTNDASATSVGNTDSSGSASSTAGFSISTYAGSSSDVTVKHGLSAVPAVMIIKNRASDSWAVYHGSNTSAPETDYLKLDTDTATTDDTDAAETWLDTAPTSAIATFGDFSATNRNTDTHVGYFWNEVQGFSKFGSYIGNGNADGTFIYTGFRPAMIIHKRTDDEGDWQMFDNKRAGYNVANYKLAPSVGDAESTSVIIDIVSNGFKFRGTPNNTSGGTFIYMAFAESPFVNSEGVPTNAR